MGQFGIASFLSLRNNLRNFPQIKSVSQVGNFSSGLCTMKFSCQLGALALLSLAQWAHGKVLPTAVSNTVRFEVDLTWEDWHDAPGAPRKMIFTNGQFPGPELRLKQGDNVEFYVNNNLPNATTIHFHGKSSSYQNFVLHI
jgi:FtsP/CotA-like multicopper oxidase with cupredoxin domain